VARFFAGIWRKMPADVLVRTVRVNGEPGVVAYLGGQPYGVLAIDVEGGAVAAIRAVVNPEKLRHVPPLQ
jgi:D-tyrosyl-tRNA(Tyr) deacylase